MQDVPKINKALSRRLLLWYRRNGRTLPWRETADAYPIWVSEIMLQQTQVDTVIPYYERFLKAFPDVSVLARAPLERVLKHWENLGYYSRARNLHKAAAILMETCDGRIPDTYEELIQLPGIGDYTAGAILSIAYGQALPAVDGNVRRILSRLFALRPPEDEAKALRALAACLIPKRHPGDFNSALMDLGAALCRPKNPDCGACPLAPLCKAYAAGWQQALPVKVKPARIPHRLAAAAVIGNDEGKILMVKRPASGLLASFWKLPGGFAGEDENMGKALRRSVKEELNLTIRVGAKLGSVQQVYTHLRTTLWAYDALIVKGHPEARACSDFKWATPADRKKLPLSKIDRKLLAML